MAPGVTPTRRERSASLPRHRPELDLGKWDPTGVGTEGTRSSLHAPSPPQTEQDVLGLQDCGARSWWSHGTPQRSAQGGSCRSGGCQRIPPRFPVLHRSLRVRALTRRAPGTALPAEAPWEPPGGGDISGTVHRWVLLGGGAEGGHPRLGDPGRAHAGLWQGHGTRRGHRVPPRQPERSRAPRGVPDVTGAGWHQVSGPQPLAAFPTTPNGC